MAIVNAFKSLIEMALYILKQPTISLGCALLCAGAAIRLYKRIKN